MKVCTAYGAKRYGWGIKQSSLVEEQQCTVPHSPPPVCMHSSLIKYWPRTNIAVSRQCATRPCRVKYTKRHVLWRVFVVARLQSGCQSPAICRSERTLNRGKEWLVCCAKDSAVWCELPYHYHLAQGKPHPVRKPPRMMTNRAHALPYYEAGFNQACHNFIHLRASASHNSIQHCSVLPHRVPVPRSKNLNNTPTFSCTTAPAHV